MAFDDQHPGAEHYYPAIERYRMENARKAKAKLFNEQHPGLVELMANSSNSFVQKIFDNYMQWGSLTEKQVAVVKSALDKAAAWKAERKAKDLQSNHVGSVGERRMFTLTKTFNTSFDSDFGTVYIIGFKDEQGNIVIYKGSSYYHVENGQSVTFKATIKAHGERDGVKQTVLARPVWPKE